MIDETNVLRSCRLLGLTKACYNNHNDMVEFCLTSKTYNMATAYGILGGMLVLTILQYSVYY
jgi:hypothetical protein